MLIKSIFPGVLMEEIITAINYYNWFSLSLLTLHHPCSPSVWFLQESIKRPIRCCISQGRDPCSALWQGQTLCWGLIYTLNRGKNKLSAWSVITAVTNELTFQPNQLTSCRKIQSDAYCTKLMEQENLHYTKTF